MRAVGHDCKYDDACGEEGGNRPGENRWSGDEHDGAHSHIGDANFGRSNAVVGDLELVGGGEVEERQRHGRTGGEEQTEEPHEHRWCEKAEGDHETAGEDEVEEVIHKEAPLDEARVSVAADRSVEEVGDVLADHHCANGEQVAKVGRREVAEDDEAERPRDRQHGQVERLDSAGHLGDKALDEGLLVRTEDRLAVFLVAAECVDTGVGVGVHEMGFRWVSHTYRIEVRGSLRHWGNPPNIAGDLAQHCPSSATLPSSENPVDPAGLPQRMQMGYRRRSSR